MEVSDTNVVEIQPVETRDSKTLTLAALCLATFVAILDITVVNLALRALQSDLHASVAALQWVVDSYNLTYASFIMSGGMLGDLLGRRRIFLIGLLFVYARIGCLWSGSGLRCFDCRACSHWARSGKSLQSFQMNRERFRAG